MSNSEGSGKGCEYGSIRDVLPARGLNPFTWLVYIGFWVIVPYYEHQARTWVYLACAVAAFILCFLGGLYGNLLLRRVSALCMLALALLYVPVNESAFGIYFYLPWFLLSVVDSELTYIWMVGLECVVIMAQAFLSHPQLDSWEWSVGVGVCALSGTNALRLRQQERANARLRTAHDEIEQLAKTAERERIARDLHDVLGHTLSLITIKSELAARLLATDPARSAQELEEIQTTARRALAEVRQTVSGYRAQGLEVEIQQAMAALAAAGVTLAGRPRQVPRLPAQYEASLALILREAITNIVRHAAARTCSITLSVTAAAVLLDVVDDGCGMTQQEGNGLLGMRERVREFGGTLRLNTSAGGGVHLAISLPLTAAGDTYAVDAESPYRALNETLNPASS